MTTEQFNKNRDAITDKELIEKAEKSLKELCSTYGRKFTMSIPPRLNDTDIILSEIIQRFKKITNN